MSTRIIILIFSIGILGTVAISCTVHRKCYEFPNEMLPHVKFEYEKICARGQVLYELSCAKCHNKKVKGKMVIPDFPQDKLAGYSFRAENSSHESELSETKVTSDELTDIIIFLTYKMKSNVELFP